MEQKEVELTYEKIQQIYNLNLSPKITSLNLSNNLIASMDGIRSLKELRTLILTGNLIESIDVMECTQLQILILDFNKIQLIQNLSNVNKLQKLYINNNKIQTMNGISQLSDLKELNLSYNQIDKIAGLPFPNKIETIELNDNNIIKIDDKTFQYCQCLVKLDLSGNSIKSYKWCIKLKDLTWLNLSRNLIEDFYLEGCNPNLETLLLAENQIQSLNQLHKCFPNLQILDLQKNQILCEYEIKFVKKLKELFELNFLGNPFCSEEVTQDFISENKNIDIVNNIEINKPGVIYIKEIQKLKELQSDLSDNQQYSSQQNKKFEDYQENQQIYQNFQDMEKNVQNLNEYLEESNTKIHEIRNQYLSIYSRRQKENILSKSCDNSLRDDSSVQSQSQYNESENNFKVKNILKPINYKKVVSNVKSLKKQHDTQVLDEFALKSKTINFSKENNKKSFISTINSMLGQDKNSIKLPSIRPISRN